MKYIQVLTLAGVVVISFGSKAMAQYNWDYSWGYSNNVRNAVERSRIEAERERLNLPSTESDDDAQPESLPSNPDEATSTTFQPQATAIMPEVIAERTAKTPQERQEVAQNLTRWLQDYTQLLRKNNKPENDVARATAFLIANNYQVYSGKKISQPQFDALVANIRTTLGQDRQFLAASDRTKQQIYEEAAIMGTYVLVAQEIAQQNKDSQSVAQLRDIAKRVVESFFEVPIEKVRLTSQGVELL